MCKIRVSQANSCQDYFLSASDMPTSRPAAQRRLNGMKFIVNSHIPEGLPLGSNKAIYVSSSICVRAPVVFVMFLISRPTQQQPPAEVIKKKKKISHIAHHPKKYSTARRKKNRTLSLPKEKDCKRQQRLQPSESSLIILSPTSTKHDVGVCVIKV